MQAEAEAAVSDLLARQAGRMGVKQAALVAMSPDGEVRAMVGGRDYAESQFNRATQAQRQPGSAFKPFVYSAALDHGYTAATIVNDSPLVEGYQEELERVWRPENFGGNYYGFVSLRYALQRSLNSVSIRIT